MAWQDPKVDWTEQYEPSTNDMNRIEGNTEQNHDDINAEESARQSADNTLQDNIDSEKSARISADNTLQDNIDSEKSARISADNTLDSEKSGLSENNTFTGNNAFSTGADLGGNGSRIKTKMHTGDLDSNGNSSFSHGLDVVNIYSITPLAYSTKPLEFGEAARWYGAGSGITIYATGTEITIECDSERHGDEPFRAIVWYID